MTITAERLAEIKREQWPHISVANITETREPWPTIRSDSDLARTVDAYLKVWVPGDCPGCGYGLFGWGIVHGAGSCSCGWPGRLYHFVRDDEGHEVVRFDALLWAHPYTVHMNRKDHG